MFDTPIGPCGVAWGPAGITGMQLPEGTATQSLAGLERRVPGASAHAVPPAIAAVIDRVVAVLDGGRDDLGDVALDLRGRSGFECRAYSVVRGIPPGSTMTYGDVAAAIGNPGLARAVGRAMGGNPFPIIVPCHRVLGADGTIGGFSAHWWPDDKAPDATCAEKASLNAKVPPCSTRPGSIRPARLWTGPATVSTSL